MGFLQTAFLPSRKDRDAVVANSRQRHANGALVGRVLEGAWRRVPPPLALTPQELGRVTPLLNRSGAASLGWWRVSASKSLAETPEAEPLHDVARVLAVRDSVQQSSIAYIAGILNDAGIVPLIFKGWAAAQNYAETYLRPYGDVDLLVRPAEHQRARDVLFRHSNIRASDPAQGMFRVKCEPAARAETVDLHGDLAAYYNTSTEALFARATRVTFLGGQSLLMPCPEDHLRIVCLHFLRHGAWRPLWLCDIAAMVEAAGPDFDWDLCLTSDAVTRGWIVAGIAAAHMLLGCRIGHLPGSIRVQAPSWLIRTILREWRAPYAHRFRNRRLAVLRDPKEWLSARWPNPIRGAFLRRGRLSHRSQMPHQIVHFFGVEIRNALFNLFSPEWWRGPMNVHE